MAINGNYSTPVTVNGFSCKNCTDVEYAKKHIDPAHPKDGPYGVNADKKSKFGPSIAFGGALSGAKAGEAPRAYEPGATLDIAA